MSVHVRTGIHTFSPAVGRLEPIRDRLRAFQSEPHPALLEHIYETRKFTSCSPMINMISPPTQKCSSGFVSGSIVPFQRTYARPKASCFGREFDFLRRHFYRAPAARGSMAHIEKYIENQNFQANSRKKSWMQNLISAAHITSSSCLDKCNRFVSNFIPSS